MLTNVIVENVGSINERVELDFSKGRYGFKDNMIYKSTVNPIAIFGSNGSGKTILLRTLSHISNLMINKSSELRPFLPNLSIDTSDESYVEIGFILEGNNYSYQISTEFDEISLEVLKFGDISLIREYSNYMVIYNQEKIKTGVIEGKFYSAIRQIGIEEYPKESPLYFVKQAYLFLSSITYIDVRSEVHGQVISQKSIEDLMVEKSNDVNQIISEYREFPTYQLKKIKRSKNNPEELVFSLDGNVYLPAMLMSNGMKTHSTLLSTILAMNGAGVLLVDELERSLHPFVAKQFVETLNDKFNIQVIFTSHNTNLLQSLRPDQIFFSKWDKERKTSIYEKLSDTYPNIREVNNIEKMYYSGQISE